MIHRTTWFTGWVLTNMIGYAIGMAIAYTVGERIDFALKYGSVGWLAYGSDLIALSLPLIALLSLVGVIQWLFLRRYIAHSTWWLSATGIGVAVFGLTCIIFLLLSFEIFRLLILHF